MQFSPGKPRIMDPMTFRLKRVPDPIAKIGGKSEGVISRSLLLASPYLIAEMPAGFDFDLKYTVISYTFTTMFPATSIETRVQGNRLTPEILKMIQNAKKNTRIWFEGHQCQRPDGERTIAINQFKDQLIHNQEVS